MNRARLALAGLLVLLPAMPARAQTLKGSHATMSRQFSIAKQHDFTFLRTNTDVKRFIGLGLLVRLPGNANYVLANVSFPYARGAVQTFVERLSEQYRNSCGEKLVVTSLTRPLNRQPRNASDLSVHPAGMAVDLRLSRKPSCRRWLESTLLSLEKRGVLDATRERFPAHYHVAVYPEHYLTYVGRLTGGRTRVAAAPAARTVVADDAVPSGPSAGEEEPSAMPYKVHRGDTLWSIARRHGTTVETLKQMNDLDDAAIRAGQVLNIPAQQ
jgi:LysM repeat protein